MREIVFKELKIHWAINKFKSEKLGYETETPVVEAIYITKDNKEYFLLRPTLLENINALLFKCYTEAIAYPKGKFEAEEKPIRFMRNVFKRGLEIIKEFINYYYKTGKYCDVPELREKLFKIIKEEYEKEKIPHEVRFNYLIKDDRQKSSKKEPFQLELEKILKRNK